MKLCSKDPPIKIFQDFQTNSIPLDEKRIHHDRCRQYTTCNQMLTCLQKSIPKKHPFPKRPDRVEPSWFASLFGARAYSVSKFPLYSFSIRLRGDDRQYKVFIIDNPIPEDFDSTLIYGGEINAQRRHEKEEAPNILYHEYLPDMSLHPGSISFFVVDENVNVHGINTHQIIAFIYGYYELSADVRSFHIDSVQTYSTYQGKGVCSQLLDKYCNYLYYQKSIDVVNLAILITDDNEGSSFMCYMKTIGQYYPLYTYYDSAWQRFPEILQVALNTQGKDFKGFFGRDPSEVSQLFMYEFFSVPFFKESSDQVLERYFGSYGFLDSMWQGIKSLFTPPRRQYSRSRKSSGRKKSSSSRRKK